MFLAFTSPGAQAEQDVSWRAIRHPAVTRLREQELGNPADARAADAFAAGLDLACRVLGGRTPLGDLRLDHQSLTAGMQAVRAGRCDRAKVRSIRDQIAEMPVVLLAHEEDAIGTVIGEIFFAVLDACGLDFDVSLVA